MPQIAAWVGVNLLAGDRAFDPFPFPDLELVISAAALMIAILILASQRRAIARASDRLFDAESADGLDRD